MASLRIDEPYRGASAQPITSFRNPKVKYVRSLRLRKYRKKEGRFLVEGIRIVEEALSCAAPLETLIYAPELLASDRATALVNRVSPDRHLVLSGDVFRTLSGRDEPQGIAGVVRIEDRPLADIPPSDDLLVVVACQLQDPGNLGAIIRTADAAAASGVIVLEPSVDVHDPRAVRATMGALFALPVIRLSDEMDLNKWFATLRAAGLPLLVVASSAHGNQDFFDVDCRRPLVLLIGRERQGLPASIHEGADAFAHLPMAGRATSLNVSAATAAMVYEVIRQRRAGGN
jgi:TrmH family RNA methyltransferase